MDMQAAIPILRIFDEAKAKEFYGGFLGFTVDWEARLCEGSPIYLQVSRGKCVLNLSEHHGDATPGSAVRIGMEDAELDAYQEGLLASGYKFARPGKPVLQTWGLRELMLTDPFGNRLVFFSRPRQPRQVEEMADEIFIIVGILDLQPEKEPRTLRFSISGTSSGIPGAFADALDREDPTGRSSARLHELLVEYAEAHAKEDGTVPKTVMLRFSMPKTEGPEEEVLFCGPGDERPNEEGVLRFPGMQMELLVE